MIAHSFAAMGGQFRRDPEVSLRHIGDGRDGGDGATPDASVRCPCPARRRDHGARRGPGGGRGDPRRACRPGAGTKLLRPYGLSLLCEALRTAGDLDGALAAVTEGLDTIDETGERWWEAELHRLRGLLLMARRDIPGADATLQRAIDIARVQQARSLELRAATSLAGLWGEQGRRAEAADLLSPVYGWFTEGFDTADLKDAKALLEELA